MQNKHIASVTANIPTSVRRFSWVRNHHYVELEDEQGNKAKLHAGGMLRGVCTKCNELNYAASNQGAMICTHCLGPVKWQWTKPQIAFMPEHEATFFGFDGPSASKPTLNIIQRFWLWLMLSTQSTKTPETIDDEKTPVGKRPS